MRARRLVSLFVVIAALVAVPAANAHAANAHAASTPGVTLSVANGYLTIVDDPGDAATVQIGSNEISGNDVVWIAGNWRWGSGVDDCYMLWDIHATSWALWCQDATQGVVLALGDGNDTVNTLPGKGFAHQTALLGDGNDVYVGGNGVDQVWGEGGNDAITTMGGNDELHGQVGDDVMAGGDGDDLLMGGAGADVMNAGAPGTGHDTVSYDDSVTPVTAKLGGGDGGNVTGKSNDGDSFSGSVGKVVGSKHGDKLIEKVKLPNGQKIRVDANDGDDKVIAGSKSPGVLDGGNGNDKVVAKNGVEDLICNAETTKVDATPKSGGGDKPVDKVTTSSAACKSG